MRPRIDLRTHASACFWKADVYIQGDILYLLFSPIMRFHFSRSQVLTTLNTFTVSLLCALAVVALAIRANHDSLLPDQARFSRTLITIAVFIPRMVIAEWRTSLSNRTNLRILATFKVIILTLLYYLFRVPDMHTAIMQDGYMIQIALHIFVTR